MKFLIILLFTTNCWAIDITNDSIVDADQLRVLNSSSITLNNNMDANANNITGISNLTATGTTTLNTGLNGFLKAASGVISDQDFIVLTSEVTGILPIVNGGTGSSSQNFVDLTTNQTISGVKTLSSPVINTAISGTAILDEDDMVSDSDTKLATQQSIKAFVLASAGSPSFTTVTKTTTATLSITGEDNVAVDAASGSFTVTLPTASGNNGLTYNISKATAVNVVTIDASGSEEIGGELTIDLTGINTSLSISSDGANWILMPDGRFGDCQTKFLSADVTTNITGISDLGYSTLRVDTKYKLCVYEHGVLVVSDAINLLGYHDGNIITDNVISSTSSTSRPKQSTRCSDSFIATTTTITFDSASITATNSISGNGTARETYVVLCEDKTGDTTAW